MVHPWDQFSEVMECADKCQSFYMIWINFWRSSRLGIEKGGLARDGGGVGGGHASPLSPLKGPIVNMNCWMKNIYLYCAFLNNFVGYLTTLFPVAGILQIIN